VSTKGRKLRDRKLSRCLEKELYNESFNQSLVSHIHSQGWATAGGSATRAAHKSD
jgi:hypothetical protein